MDTNGRMKVLRNNRGVAIVYIALMLGVLMAFAGLAVDLGYMYVAKGQLQNAADSAALAGASKLDGSVFTIQTSARNQSVKFAATNVAATNSVAISSDYSNSLTEANDVTVGNWNSTRTPKFLEGAQPTINAVRVRARRTGNTDPSGASIGGQVDLFLSKAFGWPKMSATAEAIAALPPRAVTYFMIGKKVCDLSSSITPSSPYTLVIGSQESGNMAWTSLLNKSTNADDVSNLICGNTVPTIDVCQNDIYTTQGQTSVFKDLEADFYDPYYDASDKTFDTSNNNNNNGNNNNNNGKGNNNYPVTSSWTVIVPVADDNNPGDQPGAKKVYGYATIRMTKACGPGEGSPCKGNREYFAPQKICNSSQNTIVIDKISCVSCLNSNNMLGLKPILVR